MTLSVTHTFVSGIADDPTAAAAGEVLPSHWNAGHTLTGLADLTTQVTGILPAANGGTANGFFAVSGPLTTTKTFTLPNASAVILTDNAAVTVAQGGTGAATFTAHGVLVGEGTSAFAALSVGATGTLLAGATGADPAFSATPTLGANSGTGGALTFKGSTSGSVALQVAAAAGTGTIFQLPATNGTSGWVLQTDGNGITSWVAASGGSPGGSNTQVQFNNSSAFGGSANLTWVSPTLTIGVATSTTGVLALTGATSGTISIKGQAAAGTYNLNLPITSGSSGDVLTSGGGGSAAMTWSTPTPISSLTDNYNNPATTFTSIGLVVSGTSQAAASRLIRLNYDSQDQFAVDADGAIYVYASSQNAINMYLRGNRVTSLSFFGATMLGGLANNSTTPSTGIKFGVCASTKTSNYSPAQVDTASYFDNIGATGEVDFALLVSGNTIRGTIYTFYVGAAQILKIIANTGVTIQVAGSTSSSGGSVSSNVVGNSITLYATSATTWVASSVVGTWTVA